MKKQLAKSLLLIFGGILVGFGFAMLLAGEINPEHFKIIGIVGGALGVTLLWLGLWVDKPQWHSSSTIPHP